MQAENKTAKSGLGILDVLLIIFIVLKLLGVITWSWIVVLIPLWIILGFTTLVILIYLTVYLYDKHR